MAQILVSGLINIEITLKIDGFPIDYTPVRYPFYGVNSSVSGVGFNIAKALTVLGDQVRLCSLIGEGSDPSASMVDDALRQNLIDEEFVHKTLQRTPQSVILYDDAGKRMINVDLKDIQAQKYPADAFDRALQGCQIAVLCNINFNRALLSRVRDIPIATDVHAISLLEDEYNKDFMTRAQIVFQSHEHLPASPQEWVSRMFNRYGTEIVVVGLGADGVQLGVKSDHFNERIPAVSTREVINTVGAGDALFSAFIHAYAQGDDPYKAIRKAQLFASYKIGATGGAADGFLDHATLEALAREKGVL